MENSDRQHWLWITRPEYYLDENGLDRGDLIRQVESLLMTGELP